MFSHGGTKTNAAMSQYNDTKRDMMKQDAQNQGHMQSGRGNRGGWVNRGNMRGRGGRGRGGFRTNQTNNAGAKPKNTLKFDNDYDFEQANTEFEELR